MEMRMVVVICDGKEYLGEIDDNNLDKLSRMEPVRLNNVYQFCSIDQTAVDQASGRIAGLARSYMLMNVGSASGPLPQMNLLPQGWFDVKVCNISANFVKLIAQIQQNARTASGDIIRAGADVLSTLDKMSKH